MACLVKKRGFLLLVSVVSLTTGCSFGYRAQGSLSDLAGNLRGNAFPSATLGGGRFMLADRAGLLRCEGQMAPPDQAQTPGDCLGESGHGIVQCSDGRQIPVRWQAISCRAFEGQGEDASGNRLIFRVDRSR